MNREDNERHFQHWLDKNSWRRDIQRLENQYGGPNSLQSRADATAGGTPGDRTPKPETRCPPFTDEFHFDAMSVISYLGEALAYRPHLAKCPNCPAPVRTRKGDRAHLCTVCAEIKGEANE